MKQDTLDRYNRLLDDGAPANELYDAVSELLAEVPVPVACTDRMPDDKVKVLVYHKYEGWQTAMLDSKEWITDAEWDYSYYHTFDTFTHWLPVPDAP